MLRRRLLVEVSAEQETRRSEASSRFPFPHGSAPLRINRIQELESGSIRVYFAYISFSSFAVSCRCYSREGGCILGRVPVDLGKVQPAEKKERVRDETATPCFCREESRAVRLAALHLLQRSAPRTRVSSPALLHLVSNWSAKNVIAVASAPPARPARSVYTQATTRKKRRQKGSLLPRPGSVAFVEPRVLLETMGSSAAAGTHERYAGPMPTCPHTLDDPAPKLTREMLQVPTSELYSAALEAAWQELDDDGAQGQERPTPDRVAQLEPNPKEYSSPRPRHYGPYAVERASLDWSYHVVPNRARQALQDEIVSLVLEKRLRDCRDAGDDEPCRVFEAREGFREGETTVSRVDDEDMGRKGEGRPGDKGRPLALFTAGCVFPRWSGSGHLD